MQYHVKVYKDGAQWTADVVDAPGNVLSFVTTPEHRDELLVDDSWDTNSTQPRHSDALRT
jgi:hypothetical protein